MMIINGKRKLRISPNKNTYDPWQKGDHVKISIYFKPEKQKMWFSKKIIDYSNFFATKIYRIYSIHNHQMFQRFSKGHKMRLTIDITGLGQI